MYLIFGHVHKEDQQSETTALPGLSPSKLTIKENYDNQHTISISLLHSSI